MADFSIQSADLSAPSGAGDQPVVTPKTPVSDGGTISSAISNLGNILGEGFKAYQDKQQLDLTNSILGNISSKQAVINQAVSQGTISAQEAHVRSSAVYNEALAAYPQLADKITGLNAAFKATTQTGDTDQAITDARTQAQKIASDNDTQAISHGYYISPDMTQAQRQVIWNASSGIIQAQQQLEQQQRQFQYQREQKTATQDDQDRAAKFGAITMVNKMAGDNLDAFDATGQSLVNDVKAGRKTPEEAAALLQTQFGQISGVLQSVAAGGQIDASPYRSLFENKYQLYQKMLDPKTSSDALDAQVKDQTNREKLVLLADPSTKRLVATSQLLGPASGPLLMATNAAATVKAMASISNTPVANGASNGFVAPVVGNPEVEGDALKSLKAGIDGIRGGKPVDPQQANVEASNSVNNLLVQTSDLLNKPTTPDQLKGVADFFASPQYAYMVQHGQIDPVAAQAAKKTFQKLYEPAVTQAIGDRLQGTLTNSQTKISDAIDVNFTAAGVSFSPKKGLSPQDTQAAQGIADNLRAASQGANTLVRLGAHMEGTTDYQKYWNDNKYYILPQAFPVKPGQVVSGYKWSGDGDWRDRNTWSKVGGQ